MAKLIPIMSKTSLKKVLRKAPGYPWMLHWAILSPLLAFVFITGSLHGFWGKQPQAWYELLRMAYPAVTAWMKAITKYSAVMLYIGYTIILACAILRKSNNTIFFVLRFIIAAVMYSLLLTQILKAGLGAPRPGHSLPLQPFSFLNDYSSFPSGHTVAIIAAAAPLALWLDKRTGYVLFSLLIAVVGISRLWLGVHHPVDILGGIAVGSLAARAAYCPHK